MENTHFCSITDLASYENDYQKFAEERGLKFSVAPTEYATDRHFRFEGSQSAIESAISDLGHDIEDLRDSTVEYGPIE